MAQLRILDTVNRLLKPVLIACGAIGLTALTTGCNGAMTSDPSPAPSATSVHSESNPSTVLPQPTAPPSSPAVVTAATVAESVVANGTRCVAPEIVAGNVGDSIVVIGDSLTVSVESQLRANLPGIEALAFRARTMATPLNTDSGAEAFASAPSELQRRPIRVLALGTNDLWGLQLTRNQLVDDSRRLLSTLAEVSGQPTLTLWVLPAMTAPIDDPTRAELAWFVDFLTREISRWDCVFAADWPAEIARHGSEYLQTDGVHLTEAGQTAFVDLIAREVQRLVDADKGIDNVPTD